jgi:hypothetical protein
MFNVCPSCGKYEEKKDVDLVGPFAICPFCGHQYRFVRLPLFVITGASATGKTTVCLELSRVLPDCVALECDILWRAEFNQPENDYADFRNTWLRVAKNIGQSGRPVVLCGSAVPGQYESCPERRYLAEIHYLAFVCEDGELVRRLRARPEWRGSGDPKTIEAMRAFNRWFVENADLTQPPMTVLDTTRLTVEQSVAQTVRWVGARLTEFESGL